MSWIIASLALLGGALELLGIWLTIQDLRTAGTELRKFDKEGHDIVASPFTARLGFSTSLEAKVKRAGSTEEKLNLVEADVSDLRGEIGRVKDQLRGEWQADITGAVDASERTLGDRLTRLRNYVIRDRSIYTGSRWAVLRGGIAVAVGIVCSCSSDILGAFR